MKPGRLISTTEHTSSRSAAARTSLATLTGGRPSLLAQGQGAVGLEVGSLRDPQHRVGAGHHRVERSLQALQEHAGGVGHPSFSHARAPLSQSVGAPMAPSSKPVAPVRTEEAVLQQAIDRSSRRRRPGHLVDHRVLGHAGDLATSSTRPWITGSGPWYMPWRQSGSRP